MGSRPSLPQSLFCSGSSTCSFPLWKPTKSSIPVSKPIQTGFDQLLIFVQNNPHNQSLVLVIPKTKIKLSQTHLLGGKGFASLPRNTKFYSKIRCVFLESSQA